MYGQNNNTSLYCELKQWIEVCGIPYFLPDNSPSLDELYQLDEAEEPESSSSPFNCEYDEF